MIDYPKKIKELRNKMFVTQQELAGILNVSFISVNRWERGYFEPTMKLKRKLNDLFTKYGVKVEEILWEL